MHEDAQGTGSEPGQDPDASRGPGGFGPAQQLALLLAILLFGGLLALHQHGLLPGPARDRAKEQLVDGIRGTRHLQQQAWHLAGRGRLREAGEMLDRAEEVARGLGDPARSRAVLARVRKQRAEIQERYPSRETEEDLAGIRARIAELSREPAGESREALLKRLEKLAGARAEEAKTLRNQGRTPEAEGQLRELMEHLTTTLDRKEAWLWVSGQRSPLRPFSPLLRACRDLELGDLEREVNQLKVERARLYVPGQPLAVLDWHEAQGALHYRLGKGIQGEEAIPVLEATLEACLVGIRGPDVSPGPGPHGTRGIHETLRGKVGWDFMLLANAVMGLSPVRRPPPPEAVEEVERHFSEVMVALRRKAYSWPRGGPSPMKAELEVLGKYLEALRWVPRERRERHFPRDLVHELDTIVGYNGKGVPLAELDRARIHQHVRDYHCESGLCMDLEPVAAIRARQATRLELEALRRALDALGGPPESASSTAWRRGVGIPDEYQATEAARRLEEAERRHEEIEKSLEP